MNETEGSSPPRREEVIPEDQQPNLFDRVTGVGAGLRQALLMPTRVVGQIYRRSYQIYCRLRQMCYRLRRRMTEGLIDHPIDPQRPGPPRAQHGDLSL